MSVVMRALPDLDAVYIGVLSALTARGIGAALCPFQRPPGFFFVTACCSTLSGWRAWGNDRAGHFTPPEPFRPTGSQRR